MVVAVTDHGILDSTLAAVPSVPSYLRDYTALIDMVVVDTQTSLVVVPPYLHAVYIPMDSDTFDTMLVEYVSGVPLQPDYA